MNIKKMFLPCIFCLLFIVSCANDVKTENGVIASTVSENVQNVNSEVWKDTEGKPIQTHDDILYYGGKYYWYGLDYSQNLINGGSGGFKAVKCYESEDLVNWKFKNNVLTSNSGVELVKCDINTVQVLYNKTTKKFVMWMGYNVNTYNSGLDIGAIRTYHNRLYGNSALIATCNEPDGNFYVEDSIFTVDGGAAVLTLFQDTDGTAYALDWANWDNSWRLYTHRLSDDYLSVASTESVCYPETYVGRCSVIHHNDWYYLIAASFEGELDTTADNAPGGNWMGTNGSNDGFLNYHFTYFDFYRDSSKSVPKSYAGVRYAFTKNLSDGWSDLQKLGPDYINAEFSDVIRIQGTDEISYILMFNKWNKSDLSKSGYIWQKLNFEKAKYSELFEIPYFKDYSKITINAGKGTVDAKE